MLSHAHNILIYPGVVSPVPIKDDLDGLNATDRSYISMLMKTVKLPGEATKDSHMVIHTSMSNIEMSLAS